MPRETVMQLIEGDRAHYKLLMDATLRYGMWITFLAVATLALLRVPHIEILAVIGVLLPSLCLAQMAVRDRALTQLRFYELTNKSLNGFQLDDVYASDSAQTFEVNKSGATAFRAIYSGLSENLRPKFYRCDEDSGELVGTVRFSAFTDPYDVYLRVSELNANASVVSVRAVASVLNYNPKCFEIQNLIRSWAKDAPDDIAPQELKLSRWRLPLWINVVAKSAIAMSVATLLATAGNSNPAYTASDMLDADQYAQAADVLNQERGDSYYAYDRFVALLGSKKYADAIETLDPRVDQELIAFALASEGRMDEANRMLQSIDPGEQTSDVGALYLTKAMIAESRGDKTAALEALAVARSSSTHLRNLALSEQSKLLASLGKKSDAAEVKEDLEYGISAAKDSFVSTPWQGLECLVGLFSMFLFSSFWCRRRWRLGKPELPPTQAENIEVAGDSDLQQSFDHCLLVLSENGCMITSMDDEAGLVEAVDENGSHLCLNLSHRDEGTTISIRSAGTNQVDRASVSKLKVALARS